MGDIQDSSKGHGGKRAGAGRTSLESKVLRDTKWLKARGVNPLLAHEILQRVVNEAEMWKRIFASTDDRVVLQAMMYLMSMRDGKPTQQINVNSQSITLHARDIESARAIIREIRGEALPNLAANPSLGTGVNSPLRVDDTLAMPLSYSDREQSEGELINSEQNNSKLQRKKGEHMLSGDEGGE